LSGDNIVEIRCSHNGKGLASALR